MIQHKTGCRKCGGSLIRDGVEIKCLSCGEVASDKMILSRFYDQNQKEIEADLTALGPLGTRKKWRISSSSLKYMIGRWTKIPTRITTSTSGRPGVVILPRLPDWRDDWPVEVQITWLKNWLYLVTQIKIKGVTHEQADENHR